ncbi:hypothetical protein E2C01_076475 [Portunus trituberculatus]|uniref:Uncharacterized protein n=1 Tax=Portunus trituberculatus TaxID=210409 RepID=A0A5B7IIX6_PORTR|nr:hypothetical protein [Portunus trituberculatus]
MEHPGVKQMTWWELLSVGLRLPCRRDLWRLSLPLSDRDVGFGGVALLSLAARTAVMGGVLGGMLVLEGYRFFERAGRAVDIVMITIY